MPPRRRLSPADRRAQLLDVGAQLFARHPYEDVLMEDVAERAGVSRALLYRHFAGKHDLFAAVYRQASDRLLEQVPLDRPGDLLGQLEDGLDVHLDYFVAHRNTVLAANRVLAGDPVVQTIIDWELGVLRTRLLDVLPIADDSARAAVAAVLKSWLVFVRVLCLDWLTDETCTRAELRDTCVGALLGALRPFLRDEIP
ncbi:MULTISPECIES: TetR/AcrR family transcriptional regulator [Streptomyces]|uniref:TetR family transcriptional regulator n=1 Tax=Streptomyces virginiae TaxID=1961 RepID=A0ABQ3NGR7_STRVG|nr:MULTISPECIES: TetR/AcrR family transcriptional regulator [Streptomyces]MBP2347276.1 AcrR family transcriptional regulator [Streptomyces virginiae]GGQ09062.1 TetR family transcriptional regulator [Streptomyces virginiae]GHI11971.1 TetR family transcriptional regulator [Streptomyces virginiae]